MSDTPIDPDQTSRVEVRIHEHDRIVHTARFDSLSDAEAFAEDWTERVPGATAELEDLRRTHTLYEVVEDDTAPVEDYPR